MNEQPLHTLFLLVIACAQSKRGLANERKLEGLSLLFEKVEELESLVVEEQEFVGESQKVLGGGDLQVVESVSDVHGGLQKEGTLFAQRLVDPPNVGFLFICPLFQGIQGEASGVEETEEELEFRVEGKVSGKVVGVEDVD